MAQLHVDEFTARRCREAMRARRPVTITGTDANDRVQSASGLVHAIEEIIPRGGTVYYRVTILEERHREAG